MTIPFCLAEISQNELNETWKSVTSAPFLGGELNTHGYIAESYLLISIEQWHLSVILEPPPSVLVC